MRKRSIRLVPLLPLTSALNGSTMQPIAVGAEGVTLSEVGSITEEA